MTKKKKSFEEKIIDEAREHLKKQLYDYLELDEKGNPIEPKVGIPFSKRKMEEIKASFEDIVAEGKRRNVEVYLNSKYPNVLYCKYIFFQAMTDWNV